jgi:hypothetical protein
VWQRFDDAVTTVEARFDDAQELDAHVRKLSEYRV